MLLKKLFKKIRNRFKRYYIYYVAGSQSLPPPLSPEEEIKAVNGLARGEAQARTILIEHNLRLVVYIAKKFENTGVTVDDLTSIGAIGLIKAVNTFDGTKQIKLATYASRCIENEILMYLRRSSKQRGEVSFDEPLKVDWDGNALLLSDVLGTEPDVVYKDMDDRADVQLLYNALGRLPERERNIIEMRFGLCGKQELTQKEIADCLGISQSYISRLEKRIIKRLKRDINKLR